jgi:hemoglobin
MSSGGAANTLSSGGAAMFSGGAASTTDGASTADFDAAGTLCAKYGGPEAIMTVMQQNVLGEIAADCRVNAFFAPLAPDTLARIGECLGIMAQELFACPSVVYAGSTTSTGYHCHDMKTAHTGLGVSQGDFDALIEDVVAGLSAAGVEQSDIMTAAPALLGMQSDIVESSGATPSKAACEMPTPNDAGTADGGSSADASNGDGG